MDIETIEALDAKWDEILDVLPDDVLDKLNDLPETEINSENLYKILKESGVDFEKILLGKENDGETA